jgi:transcriptional regulator ATRX
MPIVYFLILYVVEPEVTEVSKEDEEGEKTNHLGWWKQFIEGDELENINHSGKLILLFAILQECEKIGDKV